MSTKSGYFENAVISNQLSDYEKSIFFSLIITWIKFFLILIQFQENLRP